MYRTASNWLIINMKKIYVRRRADLERALGKHKREMLVIIQDVSDRAAVSARGKRPAAEDPDDKQAAKRGSGAAATAPTGKEALPSVGIAKEWSVTEILQAVAGLLRVLLFISTSRELLEAIKGLGDTGSERCGFRHMLERLLDYRGAAEEFHRFLGKFSALDLEEQPEEEGDDEDDEHEEDEEDLRRTRKRSRRSQMPT